MATLQSNYDAYKASFEKETGLKYKENIPLYIQYYGAKSADNAMQMLGFIYSDLAFHQKRTDHIIELLQGIIQTKR